MSELVLPRFILIPEDPKFYEFLYQVPDLRFVYFLGKCACIYDNLIFSHLLPGSLYRDERLQNGHAVIRIVQARYLFLQECAQDIFHFPGFFQKLFSQFFFRPLQSHYPVEVDLKPGEFDIRRRGIQLFKQGFRKTGLHFYVVNPARTLNSLNCILPGHFFYPDTVRKK